MQVKILLVIFLTVVTVKGMCQTMEGEAQALYKNAEAAYENQQYIECNQILLKVKDLLGSYNPKITYLLIKDINDAMTCNKIERSYKNYRLQLSRLDTLFSKVNKETYPIEKYNNMVKIRAETEAILTPKFEEAALTDTLNKYLVLLNTDYGKGRQSTGLSTNKLNFNQLITADAALTQFERKNSNPVPILVWYHACIKNDLDWDKSYQLAKPMYELYIKLINKKGNSDNEVKLNLAIAHAYLETVLHKNNE